MGKTDEILSNDSELQEYWKCLSTHIPGRDYGIGQLNKDNLAKQLTHSIFAVTAGHEYFGSITEYLLDCKGDKRFIIAFFFFFFFKKLMLR